MNKKISKGKKLFQKIKNIGEDKELKFWHRVGYYLGFIGLGLVAAIFTPEIMCFLFGIPKEKIEIQAYIFVFGFVVSLGVGYIRIRDKRWEFASSFNQQRWTRLSNAASLLLTEGATPQAKQVGLVELVQLKREGFQTLYINGITSSQLDLKEVNLSYANLSRSNLSDANLRGAYLKHADLSYADLRGAYLKHANLRGANLRGAYLEDADLRDVDLRDAYLEDADLSGADLSDADLDDAYLSDAQYNKDTKFPQWFNPKDHDMR